MGKHEKMSKAELVAKLERLEQRLAELEADGSESSVLKKAFRESEQRFRALIEYGNDSITVLDSEGVVRYQSPSVERQFGYSPKEYVGRKAFELIHPDDLPAVLATFKEGLQVPGAVRRVEYRFRHKDGSWRPQEGIGCNLLHEPAVRGIVVNSRDITERRQAEVERERLQEQLQQAMKMEAIGRLAGGVAHDFNNLLTSIVGNVDMARMQMAPSEPLMPMLDEIGRAADSAASLTRQLLAFSRRQIIEPRVLNLNDLTGRLQKMLVRLIGEDISLQIVLGNELGSVKVDPGQFEQVLVNLVVNARDSMPNGGRLLIETLNAELDADYCAQHPGVLPGPFVMLAVSDTGDGMTPEVKAHIFEPFFTTKPKGKGTGLGLATIFGTVKQAGGVIEVYSECGEGTVFKIYLPRVEEPAEILIKERREAQTPTGNEIILLVEDEGSVRQLAIRMLERLGYSVISAANGDEAISTVEKHDGRIDLLMTDVVMPGVNGRELSKHILKLHPEMKVLFTSGYTENVIVHHGVVEANLNFIGKPYSLQGLASKIREVLEANSEARHE